MQPSDWQRQESLREAGLVELKERSVEEVRRKQEADARRKRARRIQLDKEDRDALRKLARERNDGTKLELEPTPAGLRVTALDGTPRSAKAAGVKLRKLTQSFHERLRDPRFYGVTHEELERVVVKSKVWMAAELRSEAGAMFSSVRYLKRPGSGPMLNPSSRLVWPHHFYGEDSPPRDPTETERDRRSRFIDEAVGPFLAPCSECEDSD